MGADGSLCLCLERSSRTVAPSGVSAKRWNFTLALLPFVGVFLRGAAGRAFGDALGAHDGHGLGDVSYLFRGGLIRALVGATIAAHAWRPRRGQATVAP
jgi:hypothetical protein